MSCLKAKLPHASTSDFEAAAGGAFKGVEVALVALCLHPEQTHLALRFGQTRSGTKAGSGREQIFVNGRMLVTVRFFARFGSFDVVSPD